MPRASSERHGYTEESGDPIRVTSHMFRRWLATLALDREMSMAEVQNWLGHTHDRWTAAYDHRSPDALGREARAALGQGFGIGPIADIAGSFNSPRDRDTFLEAVLATAHITEYGMCARDWLSQPCVRHGACAACEKQLIRKGNPEHKESITRNLRENPDPAGAGEGGGRGRAGRCRQSCGPFAARGGGPRGDHGGPRRPLDRRWDLCPTRSSGAFGEGGGSAVSLATDLAPARRFRSASRLSGADIAAIKSDLRQWSKPKITWNAVVSRVRALIGRRFSRQASNRIKPFTGPMSGPRSGFAPGSLQAKRKPLAERVAILQGENRKLRQENEVLLERYRDLASQRQILRAASRPVECAAADRAAAQRPEGPRAKAAGGEARQATRTARSSPGAQAHPPIGARIQQQSPGVQPASGALSCRHLGPRYFTLWAKQAAVSTTSIVLNNSVKKCELLLLSLNFPPWVGSPVRTILVKVPPAGASEAIACSLEPPESSHSHFQCLGLEARSEDRLHRLPAPVRGRINPAGVYAAAPCA